MAAKKPVFSLEEKLLAVRDILEQMQKGLSDFDKQTELFKAGKKLITECREYLDASEVEVKKLVDGQLEDFTSK